MESYKCYQLYEPKVLVDFVSKMSIWNVLNLEKLLKDHKARVSRLNLQDFLRGNSIYESRYFPSIFICSETRITNE